MSKPIVMAAGLLSFAATVGLAGALVQMPGRRADTATRVPITVGHDNVVGLVVVVGAAAR